MGLALPAVTGSATAARAYRLYKGNLDEMVLQARKAYPREACGLIMAQPDARLVGTLFAATNAAPDPLCQFSIDADTLKRAAKLIRQGWKIEAIWHSHPNGLLELSEGDKAGAVVGGKSLYPGVIYLVVGMTENPMKVKDFFTSVTAWMWLGDATEPSPLRLIVHSG